MLRNLTAITMFVLLAACNQNEQTENNEVEAVAEPTTIEVPAGEYEIDPTHASLQFEIMHFNLSNYVARFTRFDSTIQLNPDNLSASSIVFSIDPTSVLTDYPGDYQKTHSPRTGFESFDKQIAMSDQYLNAGEYPEITFTSTSIVRTGGSSAEVTGDLNFLGVTKPVTMLVTLTGQTSERPPLNTPALGFKAEGTINTTEFGMPPFAPLGEEVRIIFNGEYALSEDDAE